MAVVRAGLLLVGLLVLLAGCQTDARGLKWRDARRDSRYDGEASSGGSTESESGYEWGYDEHVWLAYASPQEEAFDVAPESAGRVFSWWEWCKDGNYIKYVVLLVPGSYLSVDKFGDITNQHLHVGAPRDKNSSSLLNLHFAGSGDTNIWDVKTPSGWPILAKGILDDAYVESQFVNATGDALKLSTASEVWKIIKEGKAYYNLHTSVFPAGEVRGQIDWAKVAGFAIDAYDIIESLKPVEGGSEGYDGQWQQQDRPYTRDNYRQDRTYGQDSSRQERTYSQNSYRQDRVYAQDQYQQDRPYTQDNQYSYSQGHVKGYRSTGHDLPRAQDYTSVQDRYRQDRTYSNDRFRQDRTYSNDRYRQDRTYTRDYNQQGDVEYSHRG